MFCLSTPPLRRATADRTAADADRHRGCRLADEHESGRPVAFNPGYLVGARRLMVIWSLIVIPRWVLPSDPGQAAVSRADQWVLLIGFAVILTFLVLNRKRGGLLLPQMLLLFGGFTILFISDPGGRVRRRPLTSRDAVHLRLLDRRPVCSSRCSSARRRRLRGASGGATGSACVPRADGTHCRGRFDRHPVGRTKPTRFAAAARSHPSLWVLGISRSAPPAAP